MKSNAALESRARLIKIASLTALFGNAALALLKISVGLLAGSLAVIGDGIDSSTDVIIALMSLVVARIIAQPADADHPWGHGRAETIATTVLSFVLFFAGAQLILRAASSILTEDSPTVPGKLALIATGISIIGKLLLAWVQYTLGKKASSAMLIANAKNMRGDVVISAGVLVGVGFSIGLKLPIADEIVALLVGLWVIKSAIGIFKETNLELMDGSADKGPYAAVFEAVRSVPGAGNPHRARMRRIAGVWDIDLDIEVAPNLTVKAAHKISLAVERAIKERIEAVYDIVVHVEPSGSADDHEEEGYGLSEGQM